MASEIKVTFEDGGIYDGFASTYTLGNDVTYYFSFDRDYRVQLDSSGEITLQEYRNAGAWYSIDIITAVALTEIQSGGGSGDVTKEWVQDNFVLKAGDTMTGPLKFDFGSGTVIEFNHASGSNNRGVIQMNGAFMMQNDAKKTTFSIISTTSAAGIHLYKVSNAQSTIWLRNHEYGSSGTTRFIAYNAISNNDTNSTWLFNGKFQTNNDLFCKGNVYIDVNLYARLTSQSDLIGAVLNGNGLQLYSDKTVAIHKLARGETNNYYTTYKADGRSTVSTVGGQDPRYRIVGYNNFVNSTEFYDNITVKTEGESTARTQIAKGSIYTYNASNALVYAMTSTRFDIYQNVAVICHNGAGGGGSNDVQATFQVDGIRTYNYSLRTFTINGSDGAVTIQSNIGTGGTGVRIYVPNGHYSLTESAGTVTGSGLYTTCNEFYYSESMLNALNACLGHIFDKIGASYYVQFSGQSYSTGGGKSRGGGVGRK